MTAPNNSENKPRPEPDEFQDQGALDQPVQEIEPDASQEEAMKRLQDSLDTRR